MSNTLSLDHSATTILYTPLTYAYNDSSTGWLSTPDGHTTSFANASLNIEWNGKGIQVDGTAGSTVLVSLDGGALNEVQVSANQGEGLVNYPSLEYGNHTLTIVNPPGGNLTVNSLSLFGVEKFQEGLRILRSPFFPCWETNH
jgi:hypothetical protein